MNSYAYFEKSTPVLDFGPRRMGGGSRPDWLLWPAWCWKVLGLKPHRTQSDVFQRACLRLCIAGKRSAQEHAALLGLDVELCKLVLLNLQHRGLLDSRGTPAPSAADLLRDEQEDHREPVTGYLFQDPDSGELWPRFVEQLSYAEVDYLNQQGWPTLVRGSSGNPRRFRLETIFPESADIPGPPEVGDILRAIRQSFAAQRLPQEAGLIRDEEERSMGQAEEEALSSATLARVQVLSEAPEPVFLLTCLYLPQSEASEAGWCVSDPFGLGDSILLRRWIELQLRDDADKGAGARLTELLHRLVGTEVPPVKLTLEVWQSRVFEQASRELDKRFPIQLGDKRHRVLRDKLLAYEQSWQEAVDRGQKCPSEQLNHVLTQGQKVLEHLFYQMRQETNRPDLATSLPKKLVLAPQGRTQNEGLWEDVARSLGFEVPLPLSLSQVRAGKVIPALERGNASLRPMLLAALMYAAEVPGHPFWRAAPKRPGLLRELDGLAKRRDNAAHNSNQTFTLQEVEQDRTILYNSLQALLAL